MYDHTPPPPHPPPQKNKKQKTNTYNYLDTYIVLQKNLCSLKIVLIKKNSPFTIGSVNDLKTLARKQILFT